MTPHDLGLQLRQLVLRERLEGRRPDPRRLQAAIGDLCGGEHGDLVAPLRYLVLSAAFASAAGQDPPLSDPRQIGRLQQELAQLFAAPLCQRLQPVLQGLLGMAAVEPAVPPVPLVAPIENPAAAPAAVVAPPGVCPDGAGMAPPRHSGAAPLNTALAFVSGMLLMALAGIGLWMQQRPQQPQASRSTPAGTAVRPSAPPSSAAPAPTPTIPEPADMAGAGEAAEQPAPASGSGSTAEAEGVDRSLASVNALYEALSARDHARARSLYSAAVADQFDPVFFDQFMRVTVQDLRLISQSGSSVNLEGVVRFVYPDGTTQAETRTFTLDSGSDPPLITATAFGRVLKPR